MAGNPKKNPRAILLFGAPCSGKTNFAQQFSERFNAPFYDLNQIKTDLNLSDRQIIQFVELIARSKANLILEGSLDTEIDRTKLRNALRAAGYTPHLIWIQTDILTIKNRLKHKLRSINKARDLYEEKITSLEPPTDIEKPIVISGKHTFRTQLSHVLKKLTEDDTKRS